MRLGFDTKCFELLLDQQFLHDIIRRLFETIVKWFRSVIVNKKDVDVATYLQKESSRRSEGWQLARQFLGESSGKLELLEFLETFLDVLVREKRFRVFLLIPTLYNRHYLPPEILRIRFVDFKPGEISFH